MISKNSKSTNTILIRLCATLLSAVMILSLTGCSKKKLTPESKTLHLPGADWSVSHYTVSLPDAERSYTFVILNDLHIINDSEDLLPESLDSVTARRENLFIDEKGNQSQSLWLPLLKQVDAMKADGIIIAGDLVDFYSEGNLSLVKEGLSGLQTPYMYLRADHDYGNWNVALEQDEITEQENLLCPNDPVLTMDFPDLTILGVNNSTSQMKKAGMIAAKEVLAADKPVILFTHVPFAPQTDDSLAQASMKEWGDRALLWGEECYYKPSKRTQRFMNLVYAEDSPVRAVFAGHLHFPFETQLRDGLPEYVLDANYKGNISVLHVSKS